MRAALRAPSVCNATVIFLTRRVGSLRRKPPSRSSFDRQKGACKQLANRMERAMQLHEEYRPTTWNDVIGQGKIVARLERIRRRGLAGRAYWLSGATGPGMASCRRSRFAAHAPSQVCYRLCSQHGHFTERRREPASAATCGSRTGWCRGRIPSIPVHRVSLTPARGVLGWFGGCLAAGQEVCFRL